MSASLIDAARLTLADVAKRLDVNTSTVWRWTERGVGGRRPLPSLQVGGRRYILERDLEAWLQAGRREADPAEADAACRERAEQAEAQLKASGW